VAHDLSLRTKQQDEVVVEQPHLEDGGLHGLLRRGERRLVGGPLEGQEDRDRRRERQQDQARHRRHPRQRRQGSVQYGRQRAVHRCHVGPQEM
jgi:hypothetical protein